MNLVKGVADLIRKSSPAGGASGPTAGDGVGTRSSVVAASSGSGSGSKILPPSVRIRFGDSGEEGILSALWQKYENALDKVEKRSSLHVFLLHLVQTYENWSPPHTLVLAGEESKNNDTIVGCFGGHPSEVILILVQEIARVTSVVNELGNGSLENNFILSSQVDSEVLDLLKCLTILTRSVHNCQVFGYYGGVQKIIGLLKASVVQLKTLTSSLSGDEQLSICTVDKMNMIESLAVYIVTILNNFMGLKSVISEKTLSMEIKQRTHISSEPAVISSQGAESDHLQQWQQKAVVFVMEAGGVNWLVELLRVIRRLNLKEQWTDLSLHFLTLGTLKLAISKNSRAQNHFRSIGGLEVLLDGLGLPLRKISTAKQPLSVEDGRCLIFRLQILLLEVLRESVYGNVSNMQFLCENGRVHKFANSICLPGFMLQEAHSQKTDSENQLSSLSMVQESSLCSGQPDIPNLSEWNEYSIKLTRAVCSFLLPPEDINRYPDASQATQVPVSVSFSFLEISIRWILKVLRSAFPCIEACANEYLLPQHIRILGKTLQKYSLFAFRKVLMSAPNLLEVFRKEGLWNLIFSEKFGYLGQSFEIVQLRSEMERGTDPLSSFAITGEHNQLDVNILQVEAVAFLEFSASLNGSSDNLPECSVLLDMLEQYACNPGLAKILLKSLSHILQQAADQTLAAFQSLNAIFRVLKVACAQEEEIRNLKLSFTREKNEDSDIKDLHRSSMETVDNLLACMGLALALYKEYVSAAGNGRVSVLQNNSAIQCLFNLFWEKSLRKNVLEEIVELFLLPPSSAQDQLAKSQLCSKYLETFNQAKESEAYFAELSIDLLSSMREIILRDCLYYQTLFCNGECFLHIVSLLNGTPDVIIGEQLVINILHTLTLLLSGNDDTKAALRALVGVGYQTLQSLLLDLCNSVPSQQLLDALLDMLVDGNFEMSMKIAIKNEDALVLFINVLKKSSILLQHYGLDTLQKMLKDSISNRTCCTRANLLGFLLDWFSVEDSDDIIIKVAELIQILGGHSITGKDIRRIFALLRGDISSKQKHCSLLVTSIIGMLKEKGPEAFFEFSGCSSGIEIKTPVQWSSNRGFSFTCWLRVESFPEKSLMGLFSFFTDNGKGLLAMLGKDTLVYESVYQKHQCVVLALKLIPEQWNFLSITHSIGRAFSGGSQLKCYVNGELVSSQKCSYPKVNDVMSRCTVAAELMPIGEEPQSLGFERACPFTGQMGPFYVFTDALSPEQIRGIFGLGPSYMYSFLGDQNLFTISDSFNGGIFESKDGLSSKINFGLNSQACKNRTLFSVPSVLESSEKKMFEAAILEGTKLCSRHLLQEIIYCVGGVSVFFPLVTLPDKEISEDRISSHGLFNSSFNTRHVADLIELVASLLNGNISNQRQMHLISGFGILGFLFQSVPPQQLNSQTIYALKYMLDVLKDSSMSEVLLTEALSRIYLNPSIWIHASYEVQRDLYMFLIQFFESDGNLLPVLCGLPRIIDIVCNYYWEKPDSRSAVGCKPYFHPATKKLIGQRPSLQEIRKVRLLLLSLAEMSLRQKVSLADINALVAFFETSQDMACVEDVLHMVIRALSVKSFMASFLEQVNSLGGCQIFCNLLNCELEPIRLLGLQFIGKLLIGPPSEKKENSFFSISVGRPKFLFENLKKEAAVSSDLIVPSISERLFSYPMSDLLCVTLFDVLLGGASPKQVLQKRSQPDAARDKNIDSVRSSCHFQLPQILVVIFKYMQASESITSRTKILADLLELLDSNPGNIEALMEHGWSSWLETSVKLDVIQNYKLALTVDGSDSNDNEIFLVRNLYSLVLAYYLYSIKGGWHHVEETVIFLLMNAKQGILRNTFVIRDILEDVVESLLEVSSEENVFMSQPCRDNVLYLLKLLDELLISETGIELLFPCLESSLQLPIEGALGDICLSLKEIVEFEGKNHLESLPWSRVSFVVEDSTKLGCWNLYDKVWTLITSLYGKGSSRVVSKTSIGAPSIGQRARGLVESLNIPAAEMAAVVVSGGITTALGGKANQYGDKAMILRGEWCPKIMFHLVALYICRASLESASRCVPQFITLLPYILISDDEQSKNKLHLFIWSLLTARTLYGKLDDGARFHVISHIILETVICWKSMLANVISNDDSTETSSTRKETGFILSLIQKDRILAAATEEVRYVESINLDRSSQLQGLHVKVLERCTRERDILQAFEDEVLTSKNASLSADESRRVAFQLAHDEDHQIINDKWMHVFRSLIDERGPWSANPFPNNVVTHWKLDRTEDKWRRRLKLKRNYEFDERLCSPPSVKSTDEKDEPDFPSELDHKVVMKMKRLLLKGVHGIAEEQSSESTEDLGTMVGTYPRSSQSQGLVDAMESSEYSNTAHDKKESIASRESDSNEVFLTSQCVFVSPRRKLAGHLAIMPNILHFSFEFFVEGSGGSSVFNNFQQQGNLDDKFEQGRSEKQSIASTSESGESGQIIELQSKIKRHRRWNISKIKAVHWIRYLLQYTALEIFFNDSTAPVFLNFASQKDAKHAGSLIVSLRNESVNKGSYRVKSGLISLVDRRIANELAENAKERWRRRDITNFEYLMILNTVAGRSYNDLTQYPVFPWVLSDYSSEKLDFNKSSTFRDLSKPVGALDEKRFKVFEDRYLSFSDPDIPSFYYGSHYSSMGIVLYYLLRLEPFTSLHRNLQGGKFDHADRLFQSMESTYRNCLSNTSDVKELIPEFFYMPEFLQNSNEYHLGIKQDGEPLGDVVLPPWAKGSSEEFIKLNREALESEYVSSNLHHWIDLVFGYKQRGKPAVEAANIFYYLTYEGAVDMENMDDLLQKAAIEDQIANFGQTPIQIFRKRHPRRGPPIPIAHPLYFAPGSITLTSTLHSTTNPPSSVLYIGLLDSNIVLVNQGLVLSVKIWLTTQLQSGGNFTFSGSQEPFFGIGADILPPRRIGTLLAENLEFGRQSVATMQIHNENYLVICGNSDYSFQIISLSDGRVVQSIRQHKDVVSCAAVSSNGSVVVTGSYDTTVMVWHAHSLRSNDRRSRNAQPETINKDRFITQNPIHILCGHDDVITCLYVSTELDIVISGSKDGTCIFHTLRSGSYVRSIRHPSGSSLSRLISSEHGRVVFYSENDLSLHLYTINGKHLASTASNGRLNCIELSDCGEFIVCAGDQGQIVLHSMHSLDIVWRYEGVGKTICSLVVTPEECFIAGTSDGALLVYSIENPVLRKAIVPQVSRNLKGSHMFK